MAFRFSSGVDLLVALLPWWIGDYIQITWDPVHMDAAFRSVLDLLLQIPCLKCMVLEIRSCLQILEGHRGNENRLYSFKRLFDSSNQQVKTCFSMSLGFLLDIANFLGIVPGGLYVDVSSRQ